MTTTAAFAHQRSEHPNRLNRTQGRTHGLPLLDGGAGYPDGSCSLDFIESGSRLRLRSEELPMR